MSDGEIDRMVNEAESMREADEKKKAAVEARNQAESFINTVEKQMEDMLWLDVTLFEILTRSSRPSS